MKQIDYESNTKCKQIIGLLQQEPLDVMKFIKEINYCAMVKDFPSLRPLVWRLLIRYFRE